MPAIARSRAPEKDREIRNSRHAAFTLVEMLVAVGLVVLMMTLFATIFGMATGAMSTQKGLAENDQRVRLVLTRLRNDLNGNKKDQNDPNRPYRTFGWVVPWGPDEDTTATITIGTTSYTAADRKGYFYISENDPNDDTDDVLALTVQFPSGSSDTFFGKAAIVFPDGAGNYGTFVAPATSPPSPSAGAYPPAGSGSVTPANNPANGQSYWPNQPEFDDIQGTPNGAGDSQYAEVCYFLRRGTLYRRVMLIRQPNISGITPANDGTPTDISLVSLNVASLTIPSDYGMNAIRNFWTDFDYAAYFDLRSGNGLRFHGTGATSLIDSLSAVSSVPANPFTLGNPAYRFGFDSTTTLSGGAQVPSATYGQPREFISTGAGGTPASSTFFIGRFTHSETSDLNFGYPGNLAGGSGNPMNLGTNLNFNTTTGAVSNYAGPRGGEDVLMTNVLKFDIKVFDPAASAGPDGHPGVAGFVHPVTLVTDDDDGDGVADNYAEYGWPGSDDGDFRDIGHNGVTGFYGFNSSIANANPAHVPITMKYNFPAAHVGPWTSLTLGPTPAIAYSNYPNTNYHNPAAGTQGSLGSFRNRYDTWNPSLSLTNTLVGGVAQHEPPPFRPFNFGPDGHPGSATAVNPNTFIPGDDDGNGVADNVEEIGWPGTDDQPIPLSAIQIKITFFDRTSKQIRETTLVQSLHYTP